MTLAWPISVVAVGVSLLILAHGHAGAQPSTVPLTGRAPVLGIPSLITSGIPFARGVLHDLAQLRLEEPSGAEVPAQFSALARWPDGSLKAVLLSTVADTGKDHVLRYGPAASRTAARRITVAETSDKISVDTGAAVFVVSKRRFSILERIEVAGAPLVDRPIESVLKDRDGALYRSASYRGRRHEAVVEEQGPVRVVVRVSGLHTSDRGRLFPVAALVRLTFVAGDTTVHMTHTLIDQHPGPVNPQPRENPALALDGYWIEIPYRLEDAQRVRFGGDGRVHEEPVEGRVHLYQSGQFALPPREGLGPFRYSGSTPSIAGARAPGWMAIADDRRAVAVFVRHFWEQFPKELSTDGRTIEIGLHPTRAVQEVGIQTRGLPERFYSFWPGIAKTYDIAVQFPDGMPSSTALEHSSALLHQRPLLTAPPAWYAASDAFGFLSASSADGEVAFDEQMAENNRRAMQGRSGFPRAFGSRHFGDMIQSNEQWHNHHYDQPWAFVLAFLRTGRREYLDLAEIHARHHYDVNVMHVTLHDGRRILYHHGHNYNHYSGDLHNASRWHGGHTHSGGGAAYYLLTGDPRALEVLIEQWEHLAWRWTLPSPRSRSGPARRNEAERDWGFPLRLALETYHATGERRHLQLAARIVQELIQWWKEPWWHVRGLKATLSASDVARVRDLTGVSMNPGTVDGAAAIRVLETQNDEAIRLVFEQPRRLDWTQGAGYWWMHPHCDNCAIGYNGTNPWMAGILLIALVEFLEADKDHLFVDPLLLRQMLIQTTTHIVTFGWEEEKGHFVYSEHMRGDGGSSHLLMPMLYVSQVLLEPTDPRREAWLTIVERLRPPRLASRPTGGLGNPWGFAPVISVVKYFGLRTRLGLQ